MVPELARTYGVPALSLEKAIRIGLLQELGLPGSAVQKLAGKLLTSG
jgi:hypothetical protein